MEFRQRGTALKMAKGGFSHMFISHPSQRKRGIVLQPMSQKIVTQEWYLSESGEHRCNVSVFRICNSNLLGNELCCRFAALQFRGKFVAVRAEEFSIRKEQHVDLESN